MEINRSKGQNVVGVELAEDSDDEKKLLKAKMNRKRKNYLEMWQFKIKDHRAFHYFI